MTTDEKIDDLHRDLIKIGERVDALYALNAGTPDKAYRDGFAHRLNHVEDSICAMKWWGTTALGAAIVSIIGAVMSYIGLGKS